MKKRLDFFLILSYNNSCVLSYAPLAQLEEHLTLNQGVQGSSPWRRTKGTSLNIKLFGLVLLLCA